MKIRVGLVIAVITASLSLPATLAAQPGGERGASRDGNNGGRDHAARIARERAGSGRVLEVRPEQRDDGRSDYRVKILRNDGRVQVLDVDGASGEVRD
ncbi:MAG: PepSY domain-containing protein [Thiotrichales bacterium]